MQYNDVYAAIMPRLENELPAYLTYHDAAHTKSVIATAIQLGQLEQLTELELLLIKTAALFHDTGFLTMYKNHEIVSCELAKSYLPNYEYSNSNIEIICRIIMATQLPHAPNNKLEEIICDADLHYLGTDSYTENAEKLYREFKIEGIVTNRADWNTLQVRFFDTHHYFTASAMNMYKAAKQANQITLTAKSSND